MSYVPDQELDDPIGRGLYDEDDRDFGDEADDRYEMDKEDRLNPEGE